MEPRALMTATRPRLVTVRSYLETEAGGAVILLGATLLALVWANSPWRDGYFSLWATELSIELGSYHLAMDLGHWVSDGLMAAFFLLIGLEIRRELDIGDLRDRRRIALPLSAAIGGMIVPALIFLALTQDPESGRGWAMVMATDTASLIAAVWSVALFRIVRALPGEWLRRAEASTAPALADLMVPVDPELDHIRGSMGAPVTLVEYGDYECPHCRAAAPDIRQLLARMDGDLRFVARHLPLPDVHPGAALAAEAAEAAGAQGRFWEMHDALYLAAVPIGPAALDEIAASIGLDLDRFRQDLLSSRYARVVTHHVATAERSGVAGTPTFFIDDIRYRGRYDARSLETALRAALRSARLQGQPAPA